MKVVVVIVLVVIVKVIIIVLVVGVNMLVAEMNCGNMSSQIVVAEFQQSSYLRC